jgi:2-oxoglutarate ferredoxin oxidoreductase subunit alpha
VLVGGRAGEGISSAGQIVAQILSTLGYRIHLNLDYPSRIKGGHNFAIIRGSEAPIGAVRTGVDVILAMNQETLDLHRHRLSPKGVILYRKDAATVEDGIGVEVNEILSEEHAPPVMGNAAILGAFARAAGIEWSVVEGVLQRSIPKEVEQNLRVARQGFDRTKERFQIPSFDGPRLPVLTGNEAIGLGLIEGGCTLYFGYPMSPTSNLLHFLVSRSDALRIRVIQPESEIAVLLIALGAAYAGARAAVGTSGGGFCLMTEGVSLAGIAELPAVIVLGQRVGPSTGLATYTAQSDLHFALNAGQGEFPRLIVAPGDGQEAWTWARICMDLAWKYQLPAILLADKTLCEGMYSVDPEATKGERIEPILDPGKEGPYLRYTQTESGISPLRFPPAIGEVIRVNSHVHDPDGITTEEEEMTRAMVEKRQQKGKGLLAEIEKMTSVKVEGDPDASTAILCWGSNGGICQELGEQMGYRVVRPLVLSPFPEKAFARAMKRVERWIAVEGNETGQLVHLVRQYGYSPEGQVLKYNGRPFYVDELEGELRRVIS